MTTPWLPHPIVLSGDAVELRPLEIEHLDDLYKVACNPGIWRATSVDYSDPEIFYPNFLSAIRQRESQNAYPFLIVHKESSWIIGTTRLLEIVPSDRKLEIGVTWIDTAYWGGGANTECKFLLLQFCFEVLMANRVQFRAKADNVRSRSALEKIGAKFEGVQRKDKIEPNGTARDTAFYSVVCDEWPAVKRMLAEKLAASRESVLLAHAI